ncbi:PEP/pyruvate-binding domain-containing protein [Tessaracoccus flavus]|uniref:Pyruvate kinase n=1 Tax=Tessaracoccus flavus TaxID=1610493 RepID=A0A1Q2CGN6_9ACTN|nr:PEP/pyruvate-binding domain-containing protein [Tessaracoccus flavus]AQP45282.1 pyruvate kinase [Tessaracoccus flavus]SDY50268.1 Pyruvate phosphate dikinase, PEP/pyruvate binding domain [Tessaracoccus flavus]
MTEGFTRASSGIDGLDRIVDGLRLGDNVVWQVDSVDDYRLVAAPFVARAREEGRRLIYVRYGAHEPVVDESPDIEVVTVEPGFGFEAFATGVHQLIAERGRQAYYVFDCLTDLMSEWHSDLAVLNFFEVTCPFLYELDTVAYFPLVRGEHSYTTIAGIRSTTQLLLDLYSVDGNLYVHPLKVWGRHSPTMFFPHEIAGDEVRPITSSAASSQLFARISGTMDPPDHWQTLVQAGRDALRSGNPGDQAAAKRLLTEMLIGGEGRMVELADQYLSLTDLVDTASREIGTGFIGGKSVGMLVARAILARGRDERFRTRMEAHDSYFLGSDLFYSYVVANGWWRLWMEQKTPDGYFDAGARLHEKLSSGKFPPAVREQFIRMLEYFGQSPIIVRSSSLLEDNFGNAFAGKYESIFCAGQGSPEDRYQRFEDAVRAVYASAMSQEALAYRRNRGLSHLDEQMAVLVQRVSGDHHGDLFFPHAGGVGNSSNLYVWERGIDMDAGMLRIVFGLGTRAVDRTHEDYARIVTLDRPTRRPSVEEGKERRFSQHFVDVISLTDNALVTVPLGSLVSGQAGDPNGDIGADWSLFLSPDEGAKRRLRELGRTTTTPQVICDLQGLLGSTDFGDLMRGVLATLSAAYNYPVDIEFTVNLGPDGDYRFNLVQCRPLQTRGLGKAVRMPELTDPADCLFSAGGNFMGGNVRLPLDAVVYVRPGRYLGLGHQDRYAVARLVGEATRALKGRGVMAIGPGRWGTTTPSLGVPVSYSEIAAADALIEYTYPDGDFRPDLSYGSHFFQEIVEGETFYAAIFGGQPGVVFNHERLTDQPNRILDLVPGATATLADVVHVVYPANLVLYSDVVSQRVICA